ncbi:hypothetical protein [Sphingopyxis sp. 22461]|uniref:hypothetical protein n=1 Tax=Sphingopyxis sp. 22461 TaxID=3453923 RepID=UPI003F870E4E
MHTLPPEQGQEDPEYPPLDLFLRFFLLLFLRVDAFFLVDDELLLKELEGLFDDAPNWLTDPLLDDDEGAALELLDPVLGESRVCGICAVGALVEGVSVR